MKNTFHILLVRAPPDGYLPALDDSLDSYEGSGGDEGSGEGGGRAAGEGEAGLDDLGDIDADLVDLGDLDDVDYLDDLGDVNADLDEQVLMVTRGAARTKERSSSTCLSTPTSRTTLSKQKVRQRIPQSRQRSRLRTISSRRKKIPP